MLQLLGAVFDPLSFKGQIFNSYSFQRKYFTIVVNKLTIFYHFNS